MPRIRITGGRWRSRLIQVPDAEAGQALRPTPDRVRETLFNWLGQDLSGLRCLDLFAGSGILGFEAASRGADHVCLVEAHAATFRRLQAAALQLGGNEQPGPLEFKRTDALKFLAATQQSYDLVFLDPPYHQGWLERLIAPLQRVAGPQTLLYVEAERPLTALGSWQTRKSGQAGQVYFQLMEPMEPSP